jgi:hypothetical protein
MKKTETKEKQVVVTETTTKTTAICDICKTPDSEWVPPIMDEVEYSNFEYEINFSFSRDGGMHYSYGYGFIFDICPGCFTDKFLPFLEENGVNLDSCEWDW